MRLPALLLLGTIACTPEPSTPEPAAPAPLVVPRGPLPSPIALQAVDLAMTIDPRTDRFTGEASLHIHLKDSRKSIWMHGQDLDVASVSFRPPNAPAIPATWTPLSDTGTVRVEAAERLEAGDYTIDISWSAPFATDLSGLFKVEERGHAFALAKSESIQARRALPGFDEPRFKAPYRVTLTVPEGYAVIGNGAETGRTPAQDGLETVTLAETDPLPTYLLSLAVGPFESIVGPTIPPGPDRPDPIPLRGFARPGRAADLGVTLAATPPLVRILEDAFGLPFPDDKLDIVAAPAWPSGATELAAAITYREARVLLGPKDNASVDRAARQKMLSTHAHELVHMWFGNLVTPAWWNDLWLKEGFATWGSALALHTWEPDGGHDIRAAQRKLRAFSADSLASARAVREPIQGDTDIRNAYDSITYGKGMAILEMVDHGFGPDVFRPAVRAWLEANAEGSTDTESFVYAVSQASGQRALGSTFTTFLDQPGVPLVQVALDCPNGGAPSVTLRQQRYRPRGSTIRDTVRWTIPICMAIDTHPEPVCTVLDTKDHQLELPGESCPRMVRPNVGGHGYYRFTMSTGAWKDLARALPRLPAAEALVIVDSAAAGFAAQNTPAPAAFAVFEAASRHPSRHVATAPLAHIPGWKRHLNAEGKALLDTWARHTWTDARRRASRDRSAEGTLFATDLLKFDALVLEDPDARAKLVEMLERRVAGNAASLPSTAVDAALRVVAEDRGAGPLAQVTERILALDDPDLERAALTAPGHLKDPEERKAAFDQVLDGALDPRVAHARVAALMGADNDSRREDIRQRVEASWTPLSEVIPGQWRRKMPALWAGSSCSRADAQRLRTWFEGDAATVAIGHERELARAVEQIELCAARDWMSTAIPTAFP